MMKRWQDVIHENDDLDIHEVIAIRGIGKTKFGLEWVTTDSELAVVITEDSTETNKIKECSIFQKLQKNHSIIVTHNVDTLRGKISKGRKVRIFVDEYLRKDLSLNKLDDVVGHTEYKVLFIGSKTKSDDIFQISYSKQYVVGLENLIYDDPQNKQVLLNYIKQLDAETLSEYFGLPIELN